MITFLSQWQLINTCQWDTPRWSLIFLKNPLIRSFKLDLIYFLSVSDNPFCLGEVHLVSFLSQRQAITLLTLDSGNSFQLSKLRPQRDHLNSRSAITGKLKPFIKSFLLYTESNQEIVLNVQFILILPLIAFNAQVFLESYMKTT